jgi:hypothetical protein
MGTNSRVDPLSCGLDQKKKEKKRRSYKVKKNYKILPPSSQVFLTLALPSIPKNKKILK